MALGRFCLPLANGYYDTLTHECISSSQAIERKLMAGQEQEAIIDRLMRLEPAIVTICPSMQCNLRCNHCYVGHLLQKPTGVSLTDKEKTLRLIQRIQQHPGWGVRSLYFVGGEPMLHQDFILYLLDNANLNVFMTTNGVWDYESAKPIMFHKNLGGMTFSIDGLPEDHNRIRRALNHEPDTFKISYRNMAQFIRDTNKSKRVTVQGSMVDKVYTDEELHRYFSLMILAGVDPKSISIGTNAPTILKPVSNDYLKGLKARGRPVPCCDYRLGRQIMVLGDKVYATYYGMEIDEPIGTVESEPSDLLSTYRSYILKRMPILHDSTCMNECSGVGSCWGNCSNNNRLYDKGKPSDFCDRKYHEERTLEEVRLKNGNDSIGTHP